MSPLAPGAVIGILGGGQLGRMLALAAAELGFDVHVLTPEQDSPAARVAARSIVADYDDAAALLAFAEAVDVITTEFENVPAAAADALIAAHAIVAPNPRALALAQDRVAEKQLFASLGFETAPFAPIDSRADLHAALARIGAPTILKTRRLGYDGKGQARIAALADADEAFAALAPQPLILEGFCAFERELSIIAARGADGAFGAYDLSENEHGGGILRRTRAPARVSAEIEARARAMAQLLGEALDYVGVFAIEFFLMPDERLIANEMAPRVHNSGHWTQDACAASQFEQHIRAVAGWPLAATTRLCDAEMINLIGDEIDQWRAFAADPDARVHLYGKREARPGRKMGHVTRLIRR
jgi:5-(carboxyamino)imidazole ribonucleotide synthase